MILEAKGLNRNGLGLSTFWKFITPSLDLSTIIRVSPAKNPCRTRLSTCRLSALCKHRVAARRLGNRPCPLLRFAVIPVNIFQRGWFGPKRYTYRHRMTKLQLPCLITLTTRIKENQKGAKRNQVSAEAVPASLPLKRNIRPMALLARPNR